MDTSELLLKSDSLDEYANCGGVASVCENQWFGGVAGSGPGLPAGSVSTRAPQNAPHNRALQPSQRWEDKRGGGIQAPAADTRAASTTTFRLNELLASTVKKKTQTDFITADVSAQWTERRKKKKKTHGDLDFISVELGLDGGESSQLSELGQSKSKLGEEGASGDGG